MKEGKNLSRVSSLETFLREKFTVTSSERNNVNHSDELVILREKKFKVDMEENFELPMAIESKKLKKAILEYFKVSNGTAKFTNPRPQNVEDFSYEVKLPSMFMKTKGIGIITRFRDRVLITTTQLVV